jgi:DNA mismatch repair protein MutS
MTGLKNLNVDVQEKDGNIVFLLKIIEGSASRSYGFHVAKKAGERLSSFHVKKNSRSLKKAGIPSIRTDCGTGRRNRGSIGGPEQFLLQLCTNPVVERLKGWIFLKLRHLRPSAFRGTEESAEG